MKDGIVTGIMTAMETVPVVADTHSAQTPHTKKKDLKGEA